MIQIENCRAEFPAVQRTWNGKPMAFLDGPGGTQPPKAVIDAIAEYMEKYNITQRY